MLYDNTVLTKQGKRLPRSRLQEADGMMVRVDKSKTDQVGNGVLMGINAVPTSPLCAVTLLKKGHKMNPQWGKVPGQALLTLKNGKVLHRNTVANLLKDQAEREGTPRERVSCISMIYSIYGSDQAKLATNDNLVEKRFRIML